MTNDQKYEGDVKLSISPEDGGIQYLNGNPVMTGGIDNAVLISLYTNPNWWGNLTRTKESEKLGSEYEEATKGVITAGKLERIQDKARFDLQWMINEGISEDNQAVSSNPEADRIETAITVTRPALGAETHEVNWDRQFGE
jgi:phage gp46-like protein